MKRFPLAVRLWVIAPIAVISVASSTPLVARAQAAWTVGQHVEVFTYTHDGSGKNAWRKGVVTEVFNWGAHVLMDDYNETVTAGNDALRAPGTTQAAPPPGAPAGRTVPAAAGGHVGTVGAAAAAAIANRPRPAAPVRGGAPVVLGSYNCVASKTGMAIGGQSRMTFPGGNVYVDHLGVRGTYVFDATQQVLTFHGGEKNGVRASYETGPPRPVIHILSPSNRHAFDCEHA